MEITKSSMHSKITGDFAELLVLYWLSKSGFECARIDHTGIDLIAENSKTKERLGISVKSRCRIEGTEKSHLGISNNNFEKINAACKDFSLKPYFAIVIDAGNKISCYLLSEEKLLVLSPLGKKVSSWHMRSKYIKKYENDPEIKKFELDYKNKHWW